MKWKDIVPTIVAALVIGIIGTLARYEYVDSKHTMNTNSTPNYIDMGIQQAITIKTAEY